ncbi:hypothetical protein ACLMJK_001374 [Lecanora helva]
MDAACNVLDTTDAIMPNNKASSLYVKIIHTCTRSKSRALKYVLADVQASYCDVDFCFQCKDSLKRDIEKANKKNKGDPKGPKKDKDAKRRLGTGRGAGSGATATA